MVGFATRTPSSTYDFTTWLGSDPSPDDPTTPSAAPGFAAAGDRSGVTSGSDVAFALEWSGLAEAGAYFGLVSFYDSGVPDAPVPVARTLVRITRVPVDSSKNTAARQGASFTTR